MNPTRKAIQDLRLGLATSQIWLALGWNDVRNRYNRSKAGVLWAAFSLLILVSVLGPIYSNLIGIGLDAYMMHLLLGFIVWNYISGVISDSGREFVNSSQYLVSFQIGYFTLLLRVIWRNFVVMIYQMSVFLLFVVLFSSPIGLQWLLAPAAILLITLNILWMALLVSIYATRYRDFDELLNNLLRLVFFATPIIWMRNGQRELEMVAELNPFFHLIELLRGPLSSQVVEWHSWIICTLMALAGWLFSFIVFVRKRRQLAFWV